jgi:hypothetical protein
MMDIQELQGKKQQLEKELLDFIYSKAEQFRKEPGVGIEGISVYMQDVTTTGDVVRGQRSYLVADVRCDLAI